MQSSRLSKSQISSFFQRIDMSENWDANDQLLKDLHVAYTTKIPFETLDIFLNKRFSLALPDLYDKIVNRRRGGYCYELNGLLFFLLEGVGYDVTICNAHLFNNQGSIIHDSQHMVLVVNLENSWLVDVGYGNGFIEPLLLDTPQPQRQGNRTFRCIDKNYHYLVQELNNERWNPLYIFTKVPKKIADFEERNQFHQTSSESVFFKKRICMIVRHDETLELTGNELIQTTPLQKHVSIINEEDIPLLLKREFGISL